MKVILLQNIKGFGRIGDVKNVSDGHARNFLFPKKLAKVASGGALKEIETSQQNRELLNIKDKEKAEKAIKLLEGADIKFKKKASSTGKLFSSVTKEEISKQIDKLTNLTIGVDSIDLGDQGEHIKHVGQHEAALKLASGMTTKVKIVVESE
jgi:large subunit ribosomal protein L9